jgi:hypothetical protein
VCREVRSRGVAVRRLTGLCVLHTPGYEEGDDELIFDQSGLEGLSDEQVRCSWHVSYRFRTLFGKPCSPGRAHLARPARD